MLTSGIKLDVHRGVAALTTIPRNLKNDLILYHWQEMLRNFTFDREIILSRHFFK